MSFNKLIRPEFPEAGTPQHEQGLIMGWVPAILTDIEGQSTDEEGLGRIRVKCDIVDPNSNLSNSWDGYVWVLEDYVCNSTSGGSHRMLKRGTQIALVPMFGNPSHMLMLGAIHSRKDRPNPIFDRTKDVHGTQSPNQVFSIKDDVNTERTDAYPHGVVQQVGRKGDILSQTQDGSRVHQLQDGTTRMENNFSSTVLSKEGEVTSQSAGDAISILGEDGTATVRADQFDSQLFLKQLETEMTAPMPKIGSLMKQAQGMMGQLGQAGGLLTQMNGLLDQFKAGNLGGFQDLIQQAAPIVDQITNGLGNSFGKGLEVLGELQNFSPQEFGNLLMPQVNNILGSGLGEAIPQVREILGGGIGIDTIPKINQLMKSLPIDGVKGLGEDIAPILDSLSHSPEHAIEMVLSEVLPKGYKGFENLSRIGLTEHLEKLQGVLQQSNTIPVEGATGTFTGEPLNLTDQSLPAFDRLAAFKNALPADLQKFAGSDSLNQLIGGVNPNLPADFLKVDQSKIFSEFLGGMTKSFLGDTLGSLKKIAPAVGQLPQINQIMDGFLKGGNFANLGGLESLAGGLGLESLAGNPTALVEQMMSGLGQGLLPQLGTSLGDFNNLASMMPSTMPRSKVTANPITSQLEDSTGTNRVYAADYGVGATSIWGGFGFSAAGSFFNAIAPMVMQTLGAGLKLDPDAGAALQGLDGGQNPVSQVIAQGETAAMTAGGHEVAVNPDGVFIDDLNVSDLVARISALEARLSALEQPPNPLN